MIMFLSFQMFHMMLMFLERSNSMSVNMWEVTFVLWDVLVMDAHSSVFRLDDAIIVFVMMMVTNMRVK